MTNNDFSTVGADVRSDRSSSDSRRLSFREADSISPFIPDTEDSSLRLGERHRNER